MKKTDILGNTLPTLEVKIKKTKYTLLPPKYSFIKKFTAVSNKILATENLTENDILTFLDFLIEILSCNAENKKVSFKKIKKCNFNELLDILINYSQFLKNISDNPDCKLPYYPEEDSDEGYSYDVPTFYENLISKYANLSLINVMELNYVDYLMLKKNAFIHCLKQTKDGRDYLEKAYCLEQEKPDRAALRAQFGNSL